MSIIRKGGEKAAYDAGRDEMAREVLRTERYWQERIEELERELAAERSARLKAEAAAAEMRTAGKD